MDAIVAGGGGGGGTGMPGSYNPAIIGPLGGWCSTKSIEFMAL